MSVFITGGAGFIGSHLAERLLERGDKVIVLDDLSTGQMDNIGHLVGRPGFEHRVGQRHRRARWWASWWTAATSRCTWPRRSASGSSSSTRSTPSRPTSAPPRWCWTRRPRSRSWSSWPPPPRSTARGSRSPSPRTTTSSWAPPSTRAGPTPVPRRWTSGWRWPTGGRSRCPVIIARFFNTVGPRQTGRYGMVLPNFVAQALAGDPIRVFGSGEQSRCFGHVYDAVEGVLRLIETPGAVGQVINVGTDQEVTINQLAELVQDARRERIPRSCTCPTARPTPRGSRTWSAGCPTSSKLERADRVPVHPFAREHHRRRDRRAAVAAGGALRPGARHPDVPLDRPPAGRPISVDPGGLPRPRALAGLGAGPGGAAGGAAAGCRRRRTRSRSPSTTPSPTSPSRPPRCSGSTGCRSTVFVVSGHAGGTNDWGGRAQPGIPTLPLLDWPALGRLARGGVTPGRPHPDPSPAVRRCPAGAGWRTRSAGCAEDIRRQTGVRPAASPTPTATTGRRRGAVAADTYRAACTTELRLLGPRGAAHLLPRLDMYYYRGPGAWRPGAPAPSAGGWPWRARARRRPPGGPGSAMTDRPPPVPLGHRPGVQRGPGAAPVAGRAGGQRPSPRATGN